MTQTQLNLLGAICAIVVALFIGLVACSADTSADNAPKPTMPIHAGAIDVRSGMGITGDTSYVGAQVIDITTKGGTQCVLALGRGTAITCDWSTRK